MKFKFFADQCVPEEIASAFEKAGHEVIRLRTVLPVMAADPLVIEKAQQIDAILICVAYPPGEFAGNISFQLHNHPEITFLRHCSVF